MNFEEQHGAVGWVSPGGKIERGHKRERDIEDRFEHSHTSDYT
jgi:hypothetical protein